MHAHNAGMAQLSGGASFAKGLFLLFGRHCTLARNLDGHRAVELLVAGFPHAAESAHTQSLNQLETAQLRQRRRLRVALLWSTRLKWLPQALQVRSVSDVS